MTKEDLKNMYQAIMYSGMYDRYSTEYSTIHDCVSYLSSNYNRRDIQSRLRYLRARQREVWKDISRMLKDEEESDLKVQEFLWIYDCRRRQIAILEDFLKHMEAIK